MLALADWLDRNVVPLCVAIIAVSAIVIFW